jgi:hypothetical protein
MGANFGRTSQRLSPRSIQAWYYTNKLPHHTCQSPEKQRLPCKSYSTTRLGSYRCRHEGMDRINGWYLHQVVEFEFVDQQDDQDDVIKKTTTMMATTTNKKKKKKTGFYFWKERDYKYIGAIIPFSVTATATTATTTTTRSNLLVQVIVSTISCHGPNKSYLLIQANHICGFEWWVHIIHDEYVQAHLRTQFAFGYRRGHVLRIHFYRPSCT